MKKLVMLVEEMYEDLELWYPKKRMEEAGYKVVVAGPAAGGTYKGKNGYPCKADISFKQVVPSQYAGMMIPGGYAPDHLRTSQDVRKMVKKFYEMKKMIAFICHAGWVPISANILDGKRATSYIAIKDDMVNAGVTWTDQSVVVDGNLISSRSPDDLGDFCKAILKFLHKG